MAQDTRDTQDTAQKGVSTFQTSLGVKLLSLLSRVFLSRVPLFRARLSSAQVFQLIFCSLLECIFCTLFREHFSAQLVCIDNPIV